METQLVKWGNGQGIRIPKLILQELDIKVNDTLSMEVRGEQIIIEKVKFKHRSLEERARAYGENWARTQNLTGENRKDGKYGDGLCTAGRYIVAG